MAERLAVIGLDAGGTKTAAVLASVGGEVLARARSGPANYQAVGRTSARRALVEAIAPLVAAAESAGLSIATVAYGLSGLDRPRDAENLAPVLAAVTPPGARHVAVNDTFLILRAGTDDGVGVAVVSGTGPNTVGWGPSGAEARVGGLAGELGDFGGGGDIGLEGLKAARRGTDGRARPTVLTERFLRRYGLADVTDVVDWFLADAPRPFQAAELAPLVFEAAADGDAVARDILRAAGEELGLCARLVASRLFPADAVVPLVFGGSVLQRGSCPVMRDAIAAVVRAHFPLVDVRRLTVAPVLGAVLIALDALTGRRFGPALPAAADVPWPDAGVRARLEDGLRLEALSEGGTP